MEKYKTVFFRAVSILAVLFLAVSCSKEPLDNTIPAGDNTVNSLKAGSLKTITFAGYTWYVKNAAEMGPGYNSWNPDNVRVVDGKLELTLSYNLLTHKWDCAEVWTAKNLGFGTYEWEVETRVDQLHPNVVLGLFNYLPTPTSGGKKTAEIDIEFSKWAKPENDFNSSYMVWPNKTYLTSEPHEFYFGTGTQPSSKHSFTWSSKSVLFKSFYMNGLEESFDYLPVTSPTYYIPQLAQPVHMNLWVYGTSILNNKTVNNNTLQFDPGPIKVVISNFRFTKGGR